MTLHKSIMEAMIRKNGHLKLEGFETRDDLIEALRNLRQHTYMKCRKPYLGTSIDILLPDISVLEIQSSSRASVQIVAVKGKSL